MSKVDQVPDHIELPCPCSTTQSAKELFDVLALGYLLGCLVLRVSEVLQLVEVIIIETQLPDHLGIPIKRSIVECAPFAGVPSVEFASFLQKHVYTMEIPLFGSKQQRSAFLIVSGVKIGMVALKEVNDSISIIKSSDMDGVEPFIGESMDIGPVL